MERVCKVLGFPVFSKHFPARDTLLLFEDPDKFHIICLICAFSLLYLVYVFLLRLSILRICICMCTMDYFMIPLSYFIFHSGVYFTPVFFKHVYSMLVTIYIHICMWCSVSGAGPVSIRDRIVITVPSDILAPDGAAPSTGSTITSNFDTTDFNFILCQLGVFFFFKMVDVIPQIILSAEELMRGILIYLSILWTAYTTKYIHNSPVLYVLLAWRWDIPMIAPVPVKCPWRIRVN